MKKIITRRSADLSALQFSSALPSLLQRIYAARSLHHDQAISTDLKDLLKPDSMKNISQAVQLLADHITQQKRILIIGDFDADGATSTALGMLALRAMGARHVDFLVPNRFEYGYGLTPEIVDVAKKQLPDLIITVDNGISSIEGVAAARAANIAVLVTDHHLPGNELPGANAIVNPNQPGCEFPSKALAGVGVIFYLLSAVRNELRLRNWFTEKNIPEPNMADYLDLVALGTVADVVPLDRNNRILVAQGLRRMRAGKMRPGIAALLAVAKRNSSRLVASDLGFAIGPRLNAAGRLDDMSHGIQCLLCNDVNEAQQLAMELDTLNQDRRALEGLMQQEALAMVNGLQFDNDGDLPWGLCLFEPDWHQGIIGILAGRIKDRLHRPVIAFARADDGSIVGGGTIKGSARSIPGLHIRDCLDAVAAHNPGLLNKFGGHAMAAGLSLYEKDFPAFTEAFDREVRRMLGEEDLSPQIHSDGELSVEEFSLSLAQQLRDAGPWGQQCPEPLFDGVFRLVNQRRVGEKHLKLVLAHQDQPQSLIDAIAFHVDEDRWPAADCEWLRCAYKLDINEYRGQQSLQLLVEYFEVM
jgi:single-stranded-DNA-specific exonuclease